MLSGRAEREKGAEKGEVVLEGGRKVRTKCRAVWRIGGVL